MNRPSFATTIRALEVCPTPDEADIADVLRHVEVEHRGGPSRDVGADTWGACSTCATPWPCPTWNEAEQDAVLYLGRAHDRVATHARATLDRLAEADRTARRTA